MIILPYSQIAVEMINLWWFDETFFADTLRVPQTH